MISIRVGALAGLLAVAFGAFGAHALKERLGPEMLAVYQTGVLYHFFSVLVLGFFFTFTIATGVCAFKFCRLVSRSFPS